MPVAVCIHCHYEIYQCQPNSTSWLMFLWFQSTTVFMEWYSSVHTRWHALCGLIAVHLVMGRCRLSECCIWYATWLVLPVTLKLLCLTTVTFTTWIYVWFRFQLLPFISCVPQVACCCSLTMSCMLLDDWPDLIVSGAYLIV